MFYVEVAALEDVLEEAVYSLGTDARTILVQIRKCVQAVAWSLLSCEVGGAADTHVATIRLTDVT